jgi:hypothetical protein
VRSKNSLNRISQGRTYFLPSRPQASRTSTPNPYCQKRSPYSAFAWTHTSSRKSNSDLETMQLRPPLQTVRSRKLNSKITVFAQQSFGSLVFFC